jgi:hypothetical protein
VANSAQLETRESPKRRSSRIVQAVPLSVTGVDALGRPFLERTSTIVVSCHGCCYQSKHYVLKNMWVTLEVPQWEGDPSPRHVRGRVTWVQRPVGIRELFQIGVELEIPGNLWGIAFAPPDWIPFPNINRQEIAIPSLEPAESASQADTAEQAKADAVSRDHLRMVPSVGADELSAALARHMELLVGEAKQHLHETIRESATRTLSAEARPLVAALYAQFQEVERRATPGSDNAPDTPGPHTPAQAGIARPDSLKICDEVGEELESRLQGLREQWNREISESAQQASERLAAELGQLEQERRGQFEQRVESKLRQTIDNLEWAAAEARSKVAHAQEHLAGLRKQAEEAAAPLRAIEESLRAQAEISRVQFAGIETAARHFEERIAFALDKAQSDWQMSLEASMGSAAGLWNERIQALIESEVNRAQEMLRRSEAAAAESEKGVRARLAGLGSQFEEMISQAESRFGALQSAFEKGTTHAQESLAQISSLAAGMEEQGSRFGALALGAQENFERGLSELMETSSRELERRASAHIEVVLAELRSGAGGALSDVAASMENHAAAIRATLESEARRFSSEFRGSLTQQTDQAVARAQQALAAEAKASRDDLRMQGELQVSELRQAVTSMGNQAIDEFGKRLTDASDSWLSGTIVKLNEESKQRIESLAKTAESRLREACGTVFASVAETLRRRLLEPVMPPADRPREEPISDSQSHGHAESESG